MEKIEISKNNQKPLNNQELIRKSLWIDSLLHSKITNYIKANLIKGDFAYHNFSDFVRQALTLYQTKELKVDYYRIKQRKHVGVSFTTNINNFYLTIPMLKRTQIINNCLSSLLINKYNN